MSTVNKVHQPIIKKDDIDLINLIKKIWHSKKNLYITVGSAAIIGIILALTSPVSYSSSVVILPMSKSNSGMGNLSSLAGMASMAGINIGSMMGSTEDIPAKLFPEIVRSYPFLHDFIHQEYKYDKYNEPISIYDYVKKDSIESFGTTILKYSLRLPWTIKNSIFPKEDMANDNAMDYGVLNISIEEYNAFTKTQDMLNIERDLETGLVRVSATANEPLLAAQFAQKAVELLQKYIIEYKTKQVRDNLLFVEKNYYEKKYEYEHLQKEYFEYKDKHRNQVEERVDIKFQQLRDKYDIITSIYKNLAQQLEQAKVSVKEETPAFSIIEPAKVPFEKSGPNRKLIFLVWVFLGGIVGLLTIFWKDLKNRFLRAWNN